MQEDTNLTRGDIAKEIRKERQNDMGEISERAQAAARAPDRAAVYAATEIEGYGREDREEFKEFRRARMLLNAEENPSFKDVMQANAPEILELAQKEKDANPLRNGSEITRMKDAYPEIAQEEGIALKSQPGRYAVYNDIAGQAGAEIVNERDGRRLGLGNAESIDIYAKENNMTPEDVKVLKDMDARADKYRDEPVQALSKQAVEQPQIPKAIEGIDLAAIRERDSEAARAAMGLNLKNPASEPDAQAADKTIKPETITANSVEPDADSLAKKKVRETNMNLDDTEKLDIPVNVKNRYLVADGNLHDKKTMAMVVELKDNKLTAMNEDPATVQAVVDMAKHREWESITVSGTDDFKQKVWLEASARGLEVIGYDPKPVDIAKLADVMEGMAGHKSPTEKTTTSIDTNTKLTVEATPTKDIASVKNIKVAKTEVKTTTKSLSDKGDGMDKVKNLHADTLVASMKNKGWKEPHLTEMHNRATEKFSQSPDMKPPRVYDAAAPKPKTQIAQPQVQQKHPEPTR